jgi:hypothetical protein
VLHLDVIKVFYAPTDAQVNYLKNNFNIMRSLTMVITPKHVGAVLTLILM